MIAVIFSSTRAVGHTDAYDAMAARMEALAARQPGYVGLESVRADDGRGITVSYWESEAHAQAWKGIAEHEAAQQLGQQRWYTAYRVVVAQVTREYHFPQ